MMQKNEQPVGWISRAGPRLARPDRRNPPPRAYHATPHHGGLRCENGPCRPNHTTIPPYGRSPGAGKDRLSRTGSTHLTHFLERLFARKGAQASLPRRAPLQNVGLGVLVLSALSSGATAVAADKTSINLACGGAKATITCQKFKDEACVASELTFDTKDGKHVISTYQPPQHFVAPTIADGLQCDLRPPKGTYFAIEYTPGCPAAQAQCIAIKLFDLSGKKLTSKEEKTIYEYPSHATPKESVSLRGHN